MARNRADAGQQDDRDKTALAKAAPIRLLLLDVDGVLTDGTFLLSHDGKESKSFNTQDGFGLRLLHEAGIDCGVISARYSEAVAKRAQELKMRYIFQDIDNKLTVFKNVLVQAGLKPFEVAYMGDDWLDLALLGRVGLAAAPANAVAEVRDISHFIARKNGGLGAIRELCDFLLEAKGIKQQYLQKYMSR
jgi:3-deoxy-D-manno-octulosonate 8-phosphate phosphatase (KDO 8-P phosphatase)